MLISFLVPVYNTEKYIAECLESLLVQKGARFEILLLDDGSTDSSGKICDEYTEKYPNNVRVIHKDNEGLLLTRRRGFKEARGDWFICVDSDDFIEPDLLSAVSHIIDEFDCDMVMYNFDYVDDMGKHRTSRVNIPDRSVFEGDSKQLIYKERLLTNDVNSMCMRAIRRDILDIDADYSQCGIRNMCEDAVQDLALYTSAAKIVYTSKALYHYRKGQASITAKGNLENWRSRKICYEMTEPFLDIWDVSKGIKTRFYSKACEEVTDFARWLLREKDKEQIVRLIDDLCQDENFNKCCRLMDRKYISSKYMRFCVPIVVRLIKLKKVAILKSFFYLESTVQSYVMKK